MSRERLLQELEDAINKVDDSDGLLKVQVKTFGRVWGNINEDFNYIRSCVGRYQYPESVIISTVSKDTEEETGTNFTDTRNSKGQLFKQLKGMMVGEEPLCTIDNNYRQIEAELQMTKAKARFDKLYWDTSAFAAAPQG